MIRPALRSDRDAAIALMKASREGAGFDDPAGPTGFVFPFVAAYAERLFLAHVGTENACAIVLDVAGAARGILMATAAEHPFGPVWLARETLWWIDPDHRGGAALRMLDAYEAWAAAKGCAFAGMAGMGEDPAVRKLYERRGFRAVELHFLKGL